MLRKGARRDWLPAPQTRVRRDTPLLTGFPRSGRAVARGAGPNPRLAPEVAGGTVVSSSGPALPDHEQARQDPAGEQRKPASARTVIWHSALEFLLTFVLLFGVVTFVRWVIGPSAVSRAVPQIHLQLVIVGSAVALLVAGLILSPAGRVSGGHMNPRDLAGDVALRGFPRRRRAALHGVAARRLSARSAGSGRGLGQLSRPAPGVLRRAPAGSQLVSVAAVRHRGAQHVRHRAHHRVLPERALACGRGPLDMRAPRRRRYRGARHLVRGQRQPGQAIRPRPQFRRDPVPSCKSRVPRIRVPSVIFDAQRCRSSRRPRQALRRPAAGAGDGAGCRPGGVHWSTQCM